MGLRSRLRAVHIGVLHLARDSPAWNHTSNYAAPLCHVVAARARVGPIDIGHGVRIRPGYRTKGRLNARDVCGATTQLPVRGGLSTRSKPKRT